MSDKKLLVIDVAALGWEAATRLPGKFAFQKAESPFPAVTCTAQATFRTASLPKSHGCVSNGRYFPELRKVLFWEQSASLVQGPRIWERFRAKGGRAGIMFWQQSLGEALDVVFSPAPIHKHGGGMIQDCYCAPRDLQQRLVNATGRAFNLMHYWGPLASRRSSDWIVEATTALLADRAIAPDLLLTYIPHLDYDLQRFGPGSKQAAKALGVAGGYLETLRKQAEASGYEWLIFGDYSIEPATGRAIFPNRVLRESGLFATRSIKGMAYPDFFSSRAFAMADHQVAHVYLSDPALTAKVAADFLSLDGVAAVMDRTAQHAAGMAHPHGGDLVLVAKPGAWFAYPWWSGKHEAPDFASHVDIHNKPGYDPCELFFGWPPPGVSSDAARIRGTHGRGGEGNEIAWASSVSFDPAPYTLHGLAGAVKSWLEA